MPDSGALFVRTGKRGRPRTIEAPGRMLAAAIELRARVAGGDDRVFVTGKGRAMVYQDIRRFVARSTERVFGRAFSFHCFRHTAAVRVWERTHDVLVVQRYLGHKSLVWTNAYLCTLCPPLIGGPVAFAGGGTAAKPRLYDPDRAGEVRTVQAVACARARGKAASAGDEVSGERDCEVDGDRDRDRFRDGRAVHDCSEHFMPCKRGGLGAGEAAVLCTACGSQWVFKIAEGLGSAVMVSPATSCSALPVGAALREKRADAELRKGCDHSERVERVDVCGRRSQWCKLCGAFYGYVVERGKRR